MRCSLRECLRVAADAEGALSVSSSATHTSEAFRKKNAHRRTTTDKHMTGHSISSYCRASAEESVLMGYSAQSTIKREREDIEGGTVMAGNRSLASFSRPFVSNNKTFTAGVFLSYKWSRPPAAVQYSRSACRAQRTSITSTHLSQCFHFLGFRHVLWAMQRCFGATSRFGHCRFGGRDGFCLGGIMEENALAPAADPALFIAAFGWEARAELDWGFGLTAAFAGAGLLMQHTGRG